jgi:hypothetical protein
MRSNKKPENPKGLPAFNQKPDTMKKIKTEKTLLVAALALGLTISASAQSGPSSPQGAPAQGPDGGLVGNSYTEFSLGYDKQNSTPGLLHDYNFIYNESVVKDAAFGIDGNFSYDYLTGGALGYHDYRNELLLGATAYAVESWGRPFITADAGWVTQQTADLTSNAFAYSLTSGIEFPVIKDLFLTPFVSYDGEPRLRDHEPSIATLTNFQWEYGVKATYRITREWSASLTAELDQHSSKDLGLRAGLTYHF